MKMIIIPLPVSDKIKENNIYYKLNPLMKGKGAIIYMILTDIMEEPRNCSDKSQNINGREEGWLCTCLQSLGSSSKICISLNCPHPFNRMDF